MNIKKIALISSVIASAFVLSACSLGTTNSSSSQNVNTASGQAQQSASADAVTVTISDKGMTPATATVKSGGKVTWTNNSSKSVQIASDPHPTHTGNQEVSGGQFVLDIAPGSSATVTLTKKGIWGVHDHLNTSVKMKVAVE